jgi:hypothetical protein
MARLFAPYPLSGAFGGLVAYQRKDIAGTLLRTPSNLTRQRFRTDPAFANSRRTATEAGGRSKAARALRRVLHPLSPVRDHTWQGTLTGALTAVQHRDTQSVYGQRSILFSQHGHLLEGFCLSRRTPFETLVRAPLTASIDRSALSAAVAVPELLPGVNFFPSGRQPWFRLVGVLGAVPDYFYTADGYTAAGGYEKLQPAVFYGDWHPVKGGAPATTVHLALPQVPPGNAFGLVLALGFVMGVVNHKGAVEAAGYAGSGKILGVGW